jgi:CDP-glucose 4,6-dehydratase
MRNNFWGNKRVLVTGYEGFLGSHLINELVLCGALVTGLDIKTHRKETILTRGILKQIKIVKGSVEDYRLLLKILKQNKIEYVFHLAATSIVGEALGGPTKAFSTNIEGTWNVLEACRNTKGTKGVIIASSDKAYGIHNKLPYHEDASLSGSHPYDVSKSCADLLAYTYYRTYNLPICITRCGNIYGPGDFNFSRIFPDTLRCAITGKTLCIRSNGKFTRDYVYVSDIVDGYLTLAEKLNRLKLAGEAFNFSDESPITVIGLVKKIYKAAGVRENYKILNRARYEIPHQYLASSKARKVLRWKPRVSFEQGLNITVAWYKKFFSNK